MSFTCTSGKGALLVLSGKGAKQELLRSNDIFTDYILKHHESWYELAKRRHHSVRPEDIIMVRGTIKASDWTLASFASEADRKEFTLQVKGGPSAYAGVSFVRSVVHAQSVDYRTSLDASWGIRKLFKLLLPQVFPKDCLFVAQYKVKYRYNILRRKQLPAIIRAEGYRDDESRYEGDGYAEGIYAIEPSSSQEDDDKDDTYSEANSPLDVILEYILEHSECEIAIASDEDISVLRGVSILPYTLLKATYQEFSLPSEARPRYEFGACVTWAVAFYSASNRSY
ncbi:hypothetical protein BDY19DRAFT_144753 [Irpex rosettiformis]|uniref:Uncharacterized protein n=1 Tax=Irpex rosettiformis TaxID=378272 RepID=A0ACB8U374_9APHY|nr:hypothetical protein BDY19DRAFT_144753 [Irpex rosettiformis]